MPDRPPIPDPMRRSIRQRCSFGCVICGLPLYEYDHIYGYKADVGHVEAEITLLCDRHHTEKTKGLLPLEAVVSANESPYNRVHQVSTPYGLHFAGHVCRFSIGTNRYEGRRTKVVPLAIYDDDVISARFDDDQLFVSCYVVDQAGDTVVQITDNELVHSVRSWDVQFVGKTLIVRDNPRSFLFEATLSPPDMIEISRLDVRYGDTRVTVENGVLKMVGPNFSQELSGNYMSGCQYGIVLRSGPQT